MTDFAAALFGAPPASPAAPQTASAPSDIAAALYGNPPTPRAPASGAPAPPVAAPAPAPAASETVAETEARLGAALYREAAPVALNIPDNIQALRGADAPTERLYGDNIDSAVASMFREGAENIPPELDAATVTAVQVEASRMARDIGLSTNDLDTFATLGRQMRGSPPSVEQVGAWRTQAQEALVAQYGEAGAAAALKAAQALATRDPRTAQMLDQSGLGDHPDVIARFVRLALDQRHKGRLA